MTYRTRWAFALVYAGLPALLVGAGATVGSLIVQLLVWRSSELGTVALPPSR